MRHSIGLIELTAGSIQSSIGDVSKAYVYFLFCKILPTDQLIKLARIEASDNIAMIMIIK